MSGSSLSSIRARALGASASGASRAATRLRSSCDASRSISTSRSPVTARSNALTRLPGSETTSASRFSSA